MMKLIELPDEANGDPERESGAIDVNSLDNLGSPDDAESEEADGGNLSLDGLDLNDGDADDSNLDDNPEQGSTGDGPGGSPEGS